MPDGGQQKTRVTVLGIHPSIQPTNVLRQCYKPLAYPDGIYRVGPLAGLNIYDRMGTPDMDRELQEFRAAEEY